MTKYHTFTTEIRGAFCGHIWMPNIKATLPVNDDLRARFNRFSSKAGATFRDALLSLQNEKGGDFQSVNFTADTVLYIERVRTIATNHYETRVKEIPVSDLPDCADLVDQETFSYDYNDD